MTTDHSWASQQPNDGSQPGWQALPYPPGPVEYRYASPPVHPYPPQPRNGFGIAALSLGAVAVAALLLIVLMQSGGESPSADALNGMLGFTSFVCSVLAITFGAIGRSYTRRGLATNGGLAIAGLILGLVPVFFMVLGLIATIAFMASL